MSENSNPDAVELPYKTAKSSPKHLPAMMNQSGMSPVLSGNPVALGSYSLATGSLGMDKSTLKVHLPDGSFNVVRFGDATDIYLRHIMNSNNLSHSSCFTDEGFQTYSCHICSFGCGFARHRRDFWTLQRQQKSNARHHEAIYAYG